MTRDEIVEWVEDVGGDYVWEDDLFAITLLDVAIDAGGVGRLLELDALDQLAVDASRLQMAELRKLAAMKGLGSLVVAGRVLSETERSELALLGPEVDQVALD